VNFVKAVFICWFLLLGPTAFCQRVDTIWGVIRDKRGNALEFAELVFKKPGGTYRSVSKSQGKFMLAGIPAGIYSVEVSQYTKLLETQEMVLVSRDSRLLNIDLHIYYYPYQSDGKRRPACVNGHRNKLIPIVYGLPGPKMLKSAKAGKIRLGGCSPGTCSASYYCPVHEKEL
jgi:hypothetical protein